MRALGALVCVLSSAPSWAADGIGAPPGSRSSQLQDLAELRRYVGLDAAYTDVHRSLALQAISEAEAGAGKWSAAEFELQVAHVTALADNGHSSVWGGPRSRRMNQLPVRLVLFPDGVFVVRATAAAATALGLKVIDLDGTPTASVLQTLRAYRGGPDNSRDFANVDLLESPQLLHAAGIGRSDHELTLTVGDHTQAAKLVLSALPADPGEPPVQRLRYLSAQPLPNEAAGWRSAFSGQPAPLWLQQPDQPFSHRAAAAAGRGLFATEDQHGRRARRADRHVPGAG